MANDTSQLSLQLYCQIIKYTNINEKTMNVFAADAGCQKHIISIMAEVFR